MKQAICILDYTLVLPCAHALVGTGNLHQAQGHAFPPRARSGTGRATALGWAIGKPGRANNGADGPQQDRENRLFRGPSNHLFHVCYQPNIAFFSRAYDEVLLGKLRCELFP